jgi:peptide/nickel transport system substrate-binding protein
MYRAVYFAPPMMRSRAVCWRLLAYLAITLLAACRSNHAARHATSELIIAATADAYGTELGSDLAIYPINANVYETLVRLTPDYQVEPMLATRWEFRPPNTWRFHLRQGVKMHDGSTFTGEAVRWTMQRIARTGGGTLGVGERSTHVVDDSTVDITPVRLNLRLPQQLVHPSWSILAPGTEPATKTVGTGPYRLIEYVKGDHLTVERFADYWGARPKLDRLTFRFLPDPNTRVLALRSGEVQAAYEIPREAARAVARFPGVRVVTSSVGGYEALYVNIHGSPPYDLGRDDVIRRALAYAIDRADIATNVWQGTAEPSWTIVPPAILGASASLVRQMPFDTAHARAILDSAGWRRGTDGVRVKARRRLALTMVVGFPSPDIHTPMPEVVQAQLRRVGIELRIARTPDNASYQARVRTGDGDLWAEAGGQNDGNPCFLPDLLFYSGGSAPPSSYARLFAPGPPLDRFVEACRSAVESQDVQRDAAAAMRVLVDEEFVVLPLAGTYRVWGLSDAVRGFTPHPSSLSQRWDSVWLGR